MVGRDSMEIDQQKGGWIRHSERDIESATTNRVAFGRIQVGRNVCGYIIVEKSGNKS